MALSKPRHPRLGLRALSHESLCLAPTPGAGATSMKTDLVGAVSVRGMRRGAAAGLLGQAVVIASGVLTQILLARLLAPEKFGAYTLITTLVYLVAILIRV